MRLHTAEEIKQALALFGPVVVERNGCGNTSYMFARQCARSYLSAARYGQAFVPLRASELDPAFVEAFKEHAEHLAVRHAFDVMAEGDRDWRPAAHDRREAYSEARALLGKILK